MTDDCFWLVPAVAIAAVIFVGGLLIGVNQAYDNCMQYYKTMPLQEIEQLCKKITRN